MLQYILNPILTGIICGIISVLLFKLDSKITGLSKTKLEYFKIFIINSLITGVIIYIISIYLEHIELTPTSVNNKPSKNNLDADLAPF